MGIEQFGENERATEQKKAALKEGYHFDNLFDQNEDESGEKINLETGERIINDSDEEQENSEIMSVDSGGKLKDLKKEFEREAATKWLLKNGFDEQGNKMTTKKKAA